MIVHTDVVEKKCRLTICTFLHTLTLGGENDLETPLGVSGRSSLLSDVNLGGIVRLQLGVVGASLMMESSSVGESVWMTLSISAAG